MSQYLFQTCEENFLGEGQVTDTLTLFVQEGFLKSTKIRVIHHNFLLKGL